MPSRTIPKRRIFLIPKLIPGFMISGRGKRFRISSPIMMVTNRGLTEFFSNGSIVPSIFERKRDISITPIASITPGSNFIQRIAGIFGSFCSGSRLIACSFILNQSGVLSL